MLFAVSALQPGAYGPLALVLLLVLLILLVLIVLVVLVEIHDEIPPEFIYGFPAGVVYPVPAVSFQN